MKSTITVTECEGNNKITLLVHNIVHFQPDTYYGKVCTHIRLMNNEGKYVTETVEYIKQLIDN